MQHLVLFQHAARSLSFTATAKAMNLTQPAVSHAVRRLEQLLGTDLFVRDHRRLKLTAAGEKFVLEVDLGLAHIVRSIESVREGRHDDKRVTLSISTAFATHWLLPRVASFKESHPDIDLRFHTTGHDIDLMAAGVTLAVRWGDGSFPGYRSWHFCDEEVVAVCSPGYLQGRVLDCPDSLLDHPLIHLDEPHRTPLNWSQWLRLAGVEHFSPDPDIALNDYATVLQMAIEGQGIALGWRYIVDRLLQNGQLAVACATEVNTGAGFYLVSPAGMPMDERTLEVKDWMLTARGLRASAATAGPLPDSLGIANIIAAAVSGE